jgi:hypothetical protein
VGLLVVTFVFNKINRAVAVVILLNLKIWSADANSALCEALQTLYLICCRVLQLVGELLSRVMDLWFVLRTRLFAEL